MTNFTKTKYDEMREAAMLATIEWDAYSERATEYMRRMAIALVSYGGVPDDAITFFRWNEQSGSERKYLAPEDGGVYGVPQAIAFDQEDGFWHLSVCISLTQLQSVAILVCVCEKDDMQQVKFGMDKARSIDFRDANQINELIDDLVERIKQAYRTPRQSGSRTIGFKV